MQMKCSRFCTDQYRPTSLVLLKPPWEKPIAYRPSGQPYRPPHFCSRLELPRTIHDQIKVERPVAWRSPSQHHILAVQTAPRPHHDSLPTTLNSLEKAGLQRWTGPKIIMADGYQPDVPAPWQVFITMDHPPGLGSARTFLAAFREALKLDPSLEFLTIFEDDIVLSKNALDYIQRIEIPTDTAMISWYSWKWNGSGPDSLPILGIQPSRFFFDSQGLTLTRRAVDAALYCPRATGWPERNKKDILLAWTLMDTPYAEHWPNLIQHMEPINSACGHKAPKTSPTFMGTEFDAMNLMV